MKKILPVILISLFLSGCATVGTKDITNDEIVSQIEVGKSTKAEIRTLLGEPSNKVFTSQFPGEKVEEWIYVYVRSTIRPATFIPIVGIFAGGSDTEHNTLTIRFTKEGIVKDFSVSEGKMRTTTGGSE